MQHPEWGPSHPEHWGNNRADDPNRSEGGAVGLMTQTVPRGNNRADDPDCSGETTFESPVLGATCRGPALADPGSSKRGQRRRGSGYNSFN